MQNAVAPLFHVLFMNSTVSLKHYGVTANIILLTYQLTGGSYTGP